MFLVFVSNLLQIYLFKMSNQEKLKKKLTMTLKLNGFSVRSEFSTLIIESLANANIILNDNFDQYVKVILEYLEKHIEVKMCIERNHIEKAIEACIQLGTDTYEPRFQIIGAFDYPHLEYELLRKHYYIDTDTKLRIIAQSEKKSELFLKRYRNVLQRTKRSFIQKNLDLDEDSMYQLNTVDSLLTSSQKLLERSFILGSLFVNARGMYFIEDPTGMVELNLKHTNYHTGFYFENVFVLINGLYSDKVLRVSTMMLPPAEEYKDSKVMFTHLNYFGGPTEHLLRDSLKLNEHMVENPDDMFVFISDLWLDREEVFEKLEKLFEGFADIPPIAFIFMGNFLYETYEADTFGTLLKVFRRLGELIKKFDGLKRSQFTFVPGMDDPCILELLPKFALPDLLSKDFQKIVPNSSFTTNPCRIQYCTREIVIYRNDLLTKFMQESLNKPAKNKLDAFITKTITSQAHLAPFSLPAQPVHWSYDYTLHLYPLPNLIVVGDNANPYEGHNKNCTVINPGCFYKSGFSFKTYIPATDTVDDCHL